MSNKLKVAFDGPQDGWVEVRISCGGEDANIIASYTPHDSFLDLVNALYNLFLYESESKVVWNEGQSESEMRFRKTGSLVSLDVVEFPDHRRDLQPQSRLKVCGTYEEVAIPFWRALRELQGRFSPEELNAKWHRDFPSKQIEGLTSMLRQSS